MLKVQPGFFSLIKCRKNKMREEGDQLRKQLSSKKKPGFDLGNSQPIFLKKKKKRKEAKIWRFTNRKVCSKEKAAGVAVQLFFCALEESKDQYMHSPRVNLK